MVIGCKKSRARSKDDRSTLCPNHQDMLDGKTNNVNSVRVEKWKKKLAKNLDSAKKYRSNLNLKECIILAGVIGAW